MGRRLRGRRQETLEPIAPEPIIRYVNVQEYNAQFPRVCLAILGVGMLLFISLGVFFYLTGIWNAIP